MTTEEEQLTPAAADARIAALVRAIVALAAPRTDAELARDPADGWSGAHILAHVGELLPYWGQQAARVAGSERPGAPFGRTHDDPERIAAVEGHARDGKPKLLAAIAAGERDALARLHAISPDRWSRTGAHARRGVMSVSQIVQQFLLDHLEEHRAQLAAMLDTTARS